MIIPCSEAMSSFLFRKHMFRIYRGNRSFLPRDATISNIGPVSVVVSEKKNRYSSLRYLI